MASLRPASSLAALEADIAQARERLTAAKSARDACHKTYLQACLAVDTAANEVERLEKSRGYAESAAAADDARLMAELGIRFDGSHYWCGSRSHVRLADAVSYARVLLGLPAHDPRITRA